jgi:hypothetical protein
MVVMIEFSFLFHNIFNKNTYATALKFTSGIFSCFCLKLLSVFLLSMDGPENDSEPNSLILILQ